VVIFLENALQELHTYRGVFQISKQQVWRMLVNLLFAKTFTLLYYLIMLHLFSVVHVLASGCCNSGGCPFKCAVHANEVLHQSKGCVISPYELYLHLHKLLSSLIYWFSAFDCFPVHEGNQSGFRGHGYNGEALHKVNNVCLLWIFLIYTTALCIFITSTYAQRPAPSPP
jgi:hypothetical protein